MVCGKCYWCEEVDYDLCCSLKHYLVVDYYGWCHNWTDHDDVEDLEHTIDKERGKV